MIYRFVLYTPSRLHIHNHESTNGNTKENTNYIDGNNNDGNDNSRRSAMPVTINTCINVWRLMNDSLYCGLSNKLLGRWKVITFLLLIRTNQEKKKSLHSYNPFYQLQGA